MRETERVREGQNGLERVSMSVDRHVLPGESVCGGDIVCGLCVNVGVGGEACSCACRQTQVVFPEQRPRKRHHSIVCQPSERKRYFLWLSLSGLLAYSTQPRRQRLVSIHGASIATTTADSSSLAC